MENKRIINIDTSSSQKSIEELNKDINKLKQDLNSLEKGTDAYNNTLKKLSTAETNLANVNKNLINSTTGLGNNLKTVSDTFGGAVGAVQGFTSILGNLGGAGQEVNSTITRLMSITQATQAFSTGAVAVKGFNASLMALAANPVGAVIAALGVVLVGLKKGIESSSENTQKFKEVMASFQPVLDEIMKVLQGFASVVLDVAKFIIDCRNIVNGFIEKLKDGGPIMKYFGNLLQALINPLGLIKDLLVDLGVIEDNNIASVERYIKLEEDRGKLNRDEIEWIKEKAKYETDISAQRLIMNDTENKSDEERLKSKEKAINLTKEMYQKEKYLLVEKKRLLEESMKATDNTLEQERELANLEASITRLDKQRDDALRELNGTKINLNKTTGESINKIQKETDEIIKQNEEIRKNNNLAKERYDLWKGNLTDYISEALMNEDELFKLYNEKSLALKEEAEQLGINSEKYAELINLSLEYEKKATDIQIKRQKQNINEYNTNLANEKKRVEDYLNNEEKDKYWNEKKEFYLGLSNEELENQKQNLISQLENLKVIDDATIEEKERLKENLKLIDEQIIENTENALEERNTKTQLANKAFSSIVGSVSNILSAFSDNAEEGTEQWKNLKISETIISMLSGMVEAFSGASALGPVLGPIVGAAQMASIATVGMLNINKIKNTKIDKNSGNDSSISGVSSGVVNTNALNTLTTDWNALNNTTQLNDLNNNIDNQRVYVEIDDIENASNKKKVIVNNNSW